MWQVQVGAVEVIGQVRATLATFLPPRPEHEMVDDQLAASVEEISQCLFAVRSIECILLVYLGPRQLPAMPTQFITQTGQFLLAREQILSRHKPLRFGYDSRMIHLFHLYFRFQLFQFHFVFLSFGSFQLFVILTHSECGQSAGRSRARRNQHHICETHWAHWSYLPPLVGPCLLVFSRYSASRSNDASQNRRYSSIHRDACFIG